MTTVQNDLLRDRIEALKASVPALDRDSRIGTARQELLEAVNDPANPLNKFADAFKEASEEEKKAGKLIGKLLSSLGNKQIDDAFAWYAVEHNGGEELSQFQQNMALTAAIQTAAGASLDGYRQLRRVLVVLNTK